MCQFDVYKPKHLLYSRPMSPFELETIKERLKACLRTVRYQNSGCDVHAVGNIRNTAQMLLEQLEQDPQCMEDAMVRQITGNVERSVADFFTKKYQHLWRPKEPDRGKNND